MFLAYNNTLATLATLAVPTQTTNDDVSPTRTVAYPDIIQAELTMITIIMMRIIIIIIIIIISITAI